MLRADLLSQDGGIQDLTSSWRFLLGLATTLVQLCGAQMQKSLAKKGAQAFDARYLLHHGIMVDEHSRLVKTIVDTKKARESEDVSFDGATEFFFLCAALLRVSLYPLLRVEQAFHRHYNKLFSSLQKMESKRE
jgi:hypothetical protein